MFLPLTKYHMCSHFGSLNGTALTLENDDLDDVRDGLIRMKSLFRRDLAICCLAQWTRLSSSSLLWCLSEGSRDRLATFLCAKM